MRELSDQITDEDVQIVRDATKAILDAQQGPATAVNLYCIGQSSKLFYCVAAAAGDAINNVLHDGKLTRQQEKALGAALIREQYAVATGQA